MNIPDTVEGPCVALCLPIYDHPSFHFWWSLNALWRPSSFSEQFNHKGATHTIHRRGVPIDTARTLLTKQALEAKPHVTHIMFIDSDMSFPPDALLRLYEHDKDIVGGLCHSRHSPVYQPILCKKWQDGRPEYGFCFHYPKNTLFEVDATGGAFLLVKREVFEKISENFGPDQWFEHLDGYSEDFSFCERAQRCGYKIYVDTGLEIGHSAEIVITSDVAKKLRQNEWCAWSQDPGIVEGDSLASVVIPVYNQELKVLKLAVLSAAHQTVPVEIIIVDDGSDPPVPDDCWPDNVRVVHHVRSATPGPESFTATAQILANARAKGYAPAPENHGIAAALNTGIKEMKTPWFCWLSSDDIFDSRKVEHQISALLQVGGKASFHRWQALTPEGGWPKVANFVNWGGMEPQKQVLAQWCAINGSTVMIHKSVFDEVGVFNIEYKYAQDWEMWCRISERFFWYPLDEILGTRRAFGNLTSTIDGSAADDERRLRRDAEDASVKERYKWPR